MCDRGRSRSRRCSPGCRCARSARRCAPRPRCVLASSDTSTRAASAAGPMRAALGGDRRGLWLADVGGDDVRALAREAQRVGLADALRRAGDDGDTFPQPHGRGVTPARNACQGNAKRNAPLAWPPARSRPRAPRSRWSAAVAAARESTALAARSRSRRRGSSGAGAEVHRRCRQDRPMGRAASGR